MERRLPDISTQDTVSVIDEVSLWSAPFGLKLLDTVVYRPGMRVLDIGCGTGFPLIELAQRCGKSSSVCGIDPWGEALVRLKSKMEVMGINNALATQGLAEHMPFCSDAFDLIVSNNGINNVDDPLGVLAECYRVSRPGAQMVFTLNLPDTMNEFYSVFEQALRDRNRLQDVVRLEEHIFHKRKPLQYTIGMLETAGFSIASVAEESFKMRYLNGTAMFDHYFIRLAFLEPWRNIITDRMDREVLDEIEARLNTLAEQEGELSLTVPFVCIDCRRL